MADEEPKTREQRKREREQKKRERQELRARECKRLPGAKVSRSCGDPADESYGFFQMIIPAGYEEPMFEFRKTGVWEREAAFPEVECYMMRIDLPEVAEMIRALSIRYNLMVEELNRVAGSTPALAAITESASEPPVPSDRS